MNNLKFTAIIPARYASTRFPGKPLVKIGNHTMVSRVYHQVKKAVDDVWVATDDERIFEECERCGIQVVMTSPSHPSGTDRINEAVAKIGCTADVIINVQGDEPFINPEQITALKACFDDEATDIATLARRFDPEKGADALFDPNLVKVVFGNNMDALYFSRSVIPYVRGAERDQWLFKTDFYSHVGVYAYRRNVLSEVTALPRSAHEIAESLEQLRRLDNGYNIKVANTAQPTIGIDTRDDLEAAIKFATENNLLDLDPDAEQ